TLLSIFLLSIGIILALQFASVQTYVSKKVAIFLSNQLETNISIDKVYLKPFRSIELQSLLINDKKGDKLLFAKNVSAGISLTKILSNKIVIKKIEVDGAYINYELYNDS